jgi:hypothetical protein
MKHTIIRDHAEDKPQTGAVLRVEYARPIWRGRVTEDQIGTTRETVRLMRLDTREIEEVYFTACSQVSIRVKPPKK